MAGSNRTMKKPEEHARSTGIRKLESKQIDSVEDIDVDNERKPSKKVDNYKTKKRLHESRRVVFILGTVLGLLVTVFFSTVSHPTLKSELDRLVTFDSMGEIYDNWKDFLPSSISSLLTDSEFANQNDTFHGSAESFSVGRRMVQLHNLTAKHNVVMVPGVVSTGIESWGSTTDGECPSIAHFRKRLWGSFYMLRTMILDKTCWLKHIMLDTETGLDPPNIQLRAAQGFEAADFFVAGYWIWNKILQNLAVIGYGPNNMFSAGYDWRLAYLDLEKRDGYFSKVKAHIELTKKLTGQKSVLVGHSMGSQVIFYFMKWVEASGEYYGNGGSSWCNDHIESIVDISGSVLGTPKAITALMSGEMKDTVQLNSLAVYGLEKFFSRRERVDMLRTFGGVASMFPKGGEKIWGNLTSAPDDIDQDSLASIIDENENAPGHGSFGNFVRYQSKNGDCIRNMTVADSIDELLDQAPQWYSDRVKEQYSFGLETSIEQLQKNNHDHQKWSNPLEAQLPNAPDMKIYCFYGVGKPTERAYTYAEADELLNLKMIIDTDLTYPVLFGDGDGTVSLLTHSMCHEWQKGNLSRYNPGNINVTVVEIKHEPDRFDIRGGAKTAEHVDILGSAELNELILKVAGGLGDTISNRYVSDLHQIVEGMNL
jgi:phospholipid:diacylglycerol acyltransferase